MSKMHIGASVGEQKLDTPKLPVAAIHRGEPALIWDIEIGVKAMQNMRGIQSSSNEPQAKSSAKIMIGAMALLESCLSSLTLPITEMKPATV